MLHDIGELVNATLIPEEFRRTVEFAVSKSISLFEAELEIMGFTHCESGKLLGEYWNLSPQVQKTIEFHRMPGQAPAPAALPALVHLSDLLCRLHGMGYGYDELLEVDLHTDPAWGLLEQSVPQLDRFDVALFTLELDSDAEEIRHVVAAAFQS